MKKLIIILVCALAQLANAQIVKHKLYTTYFNSITHEPDSVSWDLTPDMLSCANHLPRANKFIADPQIKGTSLGKDYSHSGYDQGHQMPAQDNSCDSTGEVECFYFSNMVPQRPNLNRVTWKDLEMYCRHEASTMPIHIVCGVSGTLGVLGEDQVNIPAQCWKKIIYPDSTQLYIMPNVDSVKLHPYTYYRVVN